MNLIRTLGSSIVDLPIFRMNDLLTSIIVLSLPSLPFQTYPLISSVLLNDLMPMLSSCSSLRSSSSRCSSEKKTEQKVRLDLVDAVAGLLVEPHAAQPPEEPLVSSTLPVALQNLGWIVVVVIRA